MHELFLIVQNRMNKWKCQLTAMNQRHDATAVLRYRRNFTKCMYGPAKCRQILDWFDRFETDLTMETDGTTPIGHLKSGRHVLARRPHLLLGLRLPQVMSKTDFVPYLGLT
jgi:hypothetical protein